MFCPEISVKDGNFNGLSTNILFSDAKKIKTLNMFKDGKARRNAHGEITVSASYQSRDAPVGRIEPNRKWFGNSRVISQEALTSFRDAVAERASDPYQVLLKTNKLPMSLIRDNDTVNGLKQHQAKMEIENNPFGDTFGPKAQRKRVKLGVTSLEDFAGETAKNQDTFIEKQDQGTFEDGTPIVSGDTNTTDDAILTTARESVFSKGQSKRIWNELYKVIDSSDVVLHVLDARDPVGTRCRSVEKYIREEAPHKHLVFVLNKTDLVPTGVAVSLSSILRFRFDIHHSTCPRFVLFCFALVFVLFWFYLLSGFGLDAVPSLSQGFSCDSYVVLSQWESVCYSFGRLTLSRTEFLSEARLTGLRLEGLSQGTAVSCF